MTSPAAPQPAAGAARQVPCPTCGGPSLFAPTNTWRPFCSQRCRQIDLGAWAEERFRVPAPPPDPDSGNDGH
ncbi:DNA gyrase inhibitor YacG [Roseateles sp. BYS180W]|uniref:DNA gyrase inhibitor YacG n=1 Tax=Roseateles rivi TaxID=3299028 RepID=A0ABW7FRF5_9BURK